MRLLAITHPFFFPAEAQVCCRLLDCGYWRVHIRKPEADAPSIARLIDSIPSRYYHALSIHDHFDLALEYGLGGVHLNARNPRQPRDWDGLVSRSCHSISEISQYSHLDYLTLSPIYDSISKPGYRSRFLLDSLKGVDLSKVCALGGVTLASLSDLEAAGFAGAAMLSGAWKIKNEMLQFITHTDAGLRDVLDGGCKWVQLRIKDASDAEFAAVARRVIPLCRQYGATIIFDDRVDLAATLDCDGVHLGKNDMPVREARRILGHNKIIGATANTADDIISAYSAGADYIGLGPFRFTTTKKGLSPLLGLDGYRRIMADCRRRGVTIPVVAIGGILTGDLTALRQTGVNGVAISGLILNSDDKTQTTKTILDTWKN